MNNHLKTVLIVVAVLLVLQVAGLLWGAVELAKFKSNPPNGLGGTVNYSNSLGQTNLYATLASLLTDITSVRATLGGTKTGVTVPITWPSVTSSTGQSTTTVVTSTMTTGDFVLVTPSTSTLFISYTLGQVTAGGVTTSTIQIQTLNSSSSAITPAVTAFNYIDLASSTFVAPGALTTTSSTSN